MTLKTFHIIFVSVASLLFAFLAVWGFFLAGESSGMALGMRVTGVLGLLIMPIYGVYFYRKAAKLHL